MSSNKLNDSLMFVKNFYHQIVILHQYAGNCISSDTPVANHLKRTV